MKVELHLYATLRKYLKSKDGEEPHFAEIDDNASVKDLMIAYKVPLDDVKIIFVNGVHARLELLLKEGDRVGIFPPVGGG